MLNTSSSVLKLGKNLTMPLEMATQTTSVLGLRGAGKTNTAGVIVEELLDNNIPVLIIDPTDSWYGLLSSKSGNQKGYPIAVFGGEHGHLEVTEFDGKVVAEFCVNERVPIVLSIRHLRKGAQRRLVKELFEELYHLKGKATNRTPLTVVIDEAPLFVPQMVKGDEAQVVGAVEDLVNRGRNSGFGVVLISQRSATINKNVFDMSEAMIVHRSTGPRDRKAFRDWIEENVSVENLDEVLSSLPSLQDGEAWVWSPKLDVFGRYQIRERRTYDSSRTPRIGEIIEPPKKFAEVDREQLRKKLADNLQEVKSNDPKNLKARISELEVKLAEAESTPQIDHEAVKQQMEQEALRVAKQYHAEFVRLGTDYHRRFIAILNQLYATPARDYAVKMAEALKSLEDMSPDMLPAPEPTVTKVAIPPTIAKKVVTGVVVTAGKTDLTAIHKKIVNAIYWWKTIGITRPTKLMVATVAGYKTGRYFDDSVGQLKTLGMVVSDRDGVSLSTAGEVAVDLDGQYILSKHTFDDVCQMVRQVLPGAAHIALFDAVVVQAKLNPYNRGQLSDVDLAQRSGYAEGRYFNDTRGNLKSLGFFEYPAKGHVALSQMFDPFLKRK